MRFFSKSVLIFKIESLLIENYTVLETLDPGMHEFIIQ